LAAQLNVPARFVCAEIGVTDPLPGEQFDIVFTSYGVISWLPDLDVWAQTVARYVRPGGMFYIAEFHPALEMFDDNGEEISYSYFGEPGTIITQETVSYGGAQHAPMACYQWRHSLSDVVESLLRAGLSLEAAGVLA
jgi:SAM-dependent methyltransferase